MKSRALPLNEPMLSPKPVECRTRSTPLPFPHGAGRMAGSVSLKRIPVLLPEQMVEC